MKQTNIKQWATFILTGAEGRGASWLGPCRCVWSIHPGCRWLVPCSDCAHWSALWTRLAVLRCWIFFLLCSEERLCESQSLAVQKGAPCAFWPGLQALSGGWISYWSDHSKPDNPHHISSQVGLIGYASLSLAVTSLASFFLLFG